MQSVAHVTHEAVKKIGGIGAVLQGLLTSSAWRAKVDRDILVGPWWDTETPAHEALGPDSQVRYCKKQGVNEGPLGQNISHALAAIEADLHVNILYGTRRMAAEDGTAAQDVEVLLIDVAGMDVPGGNGKLNDLKYTFWAEYGIECGRFENNWDFEQYLRLGLPALAALRALGAVNGTGKKCWIISHEYMGMGTCLAVKATGQSGIFQTAFHAHECATARRLVEDQPGQDLGFYSAMRVGLAGGMKIDDVFGSQADFYKHQLVRNAHRLDAVMAVGKWTLTEMSAVTGTNVTASGAKFRVAYNGAPAWKLDATTKHRSRAMLRKYLANLLGWEPTYLLTHVTRLVPSKGLWRDVGLLKAMEPHLAAEGTTAVLIVLSTEGRVRTPAEVHWMEHAYGWPAVHREGPAAACDLVGSEARFGALVQRHNVMARHTRIVYINQFGFDASLIGAAVPEGMDFNELRQGTDVELGQSTYEPFGIAQIEPISFGGICVFSSACGCAAAVEDAAPTGTIGAIPADYAGLNRPVTLSLTAALELGASELHVQEAAVQKEIAKALFAALPRNKADVERQLVEGQRLGNEMGWDAVARRHILPALGM